MAALMGILPFPGTFCTPDQARVPEPKKARQAGITAERIGADTVEIRRAAKGAAFQPITEVSVATYNQMQAEGRAFQKQNPKCTAEGLPRWINCGAPLTPPPKLLQAVSEEVELATGGITLYDQQKKDVLALCRRWRRGESSLPGVRALLASDMGTGKTLVSISLALGMQRAAKNAGKRHRIAFVVPKSVVSVWYDTLRLRGVPSESLKVCCGAVTRKKRAQKRTPPEGPYAVWICTLGTLCREIETSRRKTPLLDADQIVVDEAHKGLKSWTNKSFKLLEPFLKQIKNVLYITGTPMKNGAHWESWWYLTTLMPRVFGGEMRRGYLRRYCSLVRARDPRRGGNFAVDIFDRKNRNARELRWIHESPRMLGMVRTLAGDSGLNVPRLNYEKSLDVCIARKRIPEGLGSDIESLNEEIRKLASDLSNARDSHLLELQEKIKLKTMERIRACSRAKAETMLWWLNKYLDNCDDKTLFFANHLLLLDALEEFFESHGVAFIRIDGQMSAVARAQAVRTFSDHEGTPIFALLSSGACGEGVTLYSGSVVFLEQPLSSSLKDQCIARSWRGGSPFAETRVGHLTLEGGSDMSDFRRDKRKRKNLGQIFTYSQ